MDKKVIYLESNQKLKVNGEALEFTNVVTKDALNIPFGDIALIVCDNEQAYFSVKVVNELLRRNIGFITCDDRHSPFGALIGINGHYLKTGMLHAQLSFSKKNRNRIWQKIVRAKIENQKTVLELLGSETEPVALLKKYISEVDEGDTTNREALASRVYFRAMFGPDFKRGRFRDMINSGLNYGYAVLRGCIRKELVISGLEGSIGIFHDSAENPFNLSDDIIEPFRPFVDMVVYRTCVGEGLEELTPDIRRELVGVLTQQLRLDGKRYSLAGAITEVISKVGTAIEDNVASGISLPTIIVDEQENENEICAEDDIIEKETAIQDSISKN